MIEFDRFYNGKRTVVTMSYDDGVEADRRLVEIFDRYGIRGTFHLNSGTLGKSGKIAPGEAAQLYRNHEISCHTVSHPNLEKCTGPIMIKEVLGDRENLEKLAGYPVRGMSYPFGTYNDEVVQALRLCGIVYCRTTVSTGQFQLPSNFLTWHPTCHHNQAIDHAKQYIDNLKTVWRIPLFYIWGHSYEFDNNGNWDRIEELCKMLGGRDEIWYATNIEICDYITAQRNLQISVDSKTVYNPSAMTLWFSFCGETAEIRGGETLRL